MPKQEKKTQEVNTSFQSEEDISNQHIESEASCKAKIESLEQELQDIQSKSEEYLDGWQRSRAEFVNYKKRIEREQAQLYQNTSGVIIKRYLEILDDLERALSNSPKDGEGAIWAEGIHLIYRKFLSLLENEGVTIMNAQGEQFDPNRHEAIMSEETDKYESGQIIEVLKQGYMLGERVLRPASVRVAR